MTSPSATIRQPADMGQVFIPLTLTNYTDTVRAEDGEIPASAVRSLALPAVLADTGATELCLPRRIIEALGLRPLREVVVETANGVTPTRIFGGVLLTVDGRSVQTECIELPGGENALLGAIPMESLGIELDLRARTYRLLPEGPTQSYHYA